MSLVEKTEFLLFEFPYFRVLPRQRNGSVWAVKADAQNAHLSPLHWHKINLNPKNWIDLVFLKQNLKIRLFGRNWTGNLGPGVSGRERRVEGISSRNNWQTMANATHSTRATRATRLLGLVRSCFHYRHVNSSCALSIHPSAQYPQMKSHNWAERLLWCHNLVLNLMVIHGTFNCGSKIRPAGFALFEEAA